MLKKWLEKVLPRPRLVSVPVDCPPLQHYPGYLPEDASLLARYAHTEAKVTADYYVDGFGVNTDLSCVPFVDPSNLAVERLQLPLPDDGFHAEGIEYAALLDAFENRKLESRFTAVELGSGWGPWIGLAGVLANTNGIHDICLIGAEASPERYALMCQHLERNGLVSGRRAKVKTFQGAVWTHDGEVRFPDSDVADMGPAASADYSKTDYRGRRVNFFSTPCVTMSSLCKGVEAVDFLHIDVQGSEQELIMSEIEWLSSHVHSMMVATHSRVIEGALMDLLGNAGWVLKREKPCRFLMDGLPQVSWEGLTQADGSQHWVNSGV